MASAAPYPAADSRFVVRSAQPGDIAGLSEVEREAFPEQWPPTRFEREIKRSDALYLMATAEQPAQPPETRDEPEHPEFPGSTRSVQRHPPLLKLMNGVRRLAFPAITPRRVEPALSLSYVAGFIGIWYVVDEAHIVSIAVRRSERRRGVGELLLLGAFQGARGRGMKELTLEVRKSNVAAQALYVKYGFREVGLRKRYYVDNSEDALIMTTPPLNSLEFSRRVQELAREHRQRWGAAAAV
ncbi:MAG: ribosomal protein S18-alanine N-acetyltransferase [Chloroflexi bacterium]|nr:ribosomal protein S18-alanine N-acetyltransferase [Chloroflexota bacterium]